MTRVGHILKIEDNYLKRLLDGSKTHEVRFNDRDYQVKDSIAFDATEDMLQRFIPTTILFGRPLYKFEITHIHSNLGLKEGYVVLSLKRLDS